MHPITLLSTCYKLLMRCFAQRLISWIMDNEALSPCQKGFLPHDGCLEHNYVLHERIRRAKEKRSELFITFMDISCAFSSLSHDALFSSLTRYGLRETFVSLMADAYGDNQTQFLCSSGLTDPVSVASGVRQGCPISRILFNLCIDPILHELQGDAVEHRFLAYPMILCCLPLSQKRCRT